MRMDEHTAKLILEIEGDPPLDVLTEIFEEKIFEIRTDFLRTTIVPLIYRAKIKRIKRLMEAYHTISNIEFPPSEGAEVSLDTQDLLALFRSFEKESTTLRTKIATTFHPSEIISNVESLIDIQEKYEASFLKLVDAIPISEQKILKSEMISTGKAIRLMMQDFESAELKTLLSLEKKRITS